MNPKKEILKEEGKYLSLLYLLSRIDPEEVNNPSTAIVDIAGKRFISAQTLASTFPRAKVYSFDHDLLGISSYYLIDPEVTTNYVQRSLDSWYTNIVFVPRNIRYFPTVLEGELSPKIFCLDFCNSYKEFDLGGMPKLFRQNPPPEDSYVIYNTDITRNGRKGGYEAARKRVEKVFRSQVTNLASASYVSSFRDHGRPTSFERLWTLWRKR